MPVGMLKDKVAVITGAGHGMGRSAARLFANYGARLVLADINMHAAEAAALDVRNDGGEAIAVHADITSDDDVKRMVAAALDTYGRLDCAFNNAGGSTDLASVHELSRESWESNIKLNLTGSWLCSPLCSFLTGQAIAVDGGQLARQ